MNQYHVIVLTTGYLSAFKGFIRLWLRGCSLGSGKIPKPQTYRDYASNYLEGLEKAERAMSNSALAYGGTLIQLLENEPPYMDRESIFDDVTLKRDDWGILFGILGTAIDGFLLFHEASHILAGDAVGTERTPENETETDQGAVSLCIIDEARGGGFGTVHLGGPMFFCVELLRLLFEEILEFKARRHDPAEGRYAGINELMMRSSLYNRYVHTFLGEKQHKLYLEWSAAMGLVFDSVRWALMSNFHPELSLSQFVLSHKRAREEEAKRGR